MSNATKMVIEWLAAAGRTVNGQHLAAKIAQDHRYEEEPKGCLLTWLEEHVPCDDIDVEACEVDWPLVTAAVLKRHGR